MYLVEVRVSKSELHLIKTLLFHPGGGEGADTSRCVLRPAPNHFTVIHAVRVPQVIVESSLNEEEARLVHITSPDGWLGHSVHLLSPDNIQICGTPDLLPDVGEGVVAKKPDLLAVLDRGLAILERRQVLEGTIHPDAEERRLVRQVPVDVVCGRFLCGEPVVVVMLGLAYAPLLELVAVPETIISTVTNWGRIEFVLIQNIHTCQP